MCGDAVGGGDEVRAERVDHLLEVDPEAVCSQVDGCDSSRRDCAREPRRDRRDRQDPCVFYARCLPDSNCRCRRLSANAPRPSYAKERGRCRRLLAGVARVICGWYAIKPTARPLQRASPMRRPRSSTTFGRPANLATIRHRTMPYRRTDWTTSAFESATRFHGSRPCSSSSANQTRPIR